MFNEKILTSFEYYLRPVCCNCGNSNEIELQNYLDHVRPWWKRQLSSSLRGNSYSDSSSVSSNQSPLGGRPPDQVNKKGHRLRHELTRQVAFDELASFSGQSSLSDDFMVLPTTTTATVAATVAPLRARVIPSTTTTTATTETVLDSASLKAKRKTFIKSKKANKSTTTTIVAAVDVHSFPSSTVFLEDDFDGDDDPWLIYDLESYLDSKATFISDKSNHLACFEDDSDIFY